MTPVIREPLVVNEAFTAGFSIFERIPSRSSVSGAVSTIGRYPPSAVGAKVTQPRSRVLPIGKIFLPIVSSIRAVTRPASALAAFASSVVTSGSIAVTGRSTVSWLGASTSARALVDLGDRLGRVGRAAGVARDDA